MTVLRGIAVMLLLFACTYTDIKKREIPDILCALTALAGFIGFNPDNLWGLSVALVYLILAVILGGIGGGDVKLFAALSIGIGFVGSIALLLISLLSMLIFYAVYAAVYKLKGKTAAKVLPFAPFFTAGYFIILL